MRQVLLVVVCLIIALPSYAADGKGAFFLGGGAGGVKCPEFVADMERARSKRFGTPAYVNVTQGFTMYILGFQSGYNMNKPDTYDIFPDDKGDYPLLSWVENWCRARPTSRFGDGVIALAQDRHFKRQRSAEPSK